MGDLRPFQLSLLAAPTAILAGRSAADSLRARGLELSIDGRLGHVRFVSSSETAQMAEVLLEREARGLRVPLIARLVFLLTGLLSTLVWYRAGATDATAPAFFISVVAVILTGILFNLYLYDRLRRGGAVAWVGTIGAGFDAGMAGVYLILALWAGRNSNLSPAFVFNTELPVTYCALVVINGLSLRPRYPLIVGVGAVSSLMAALVLALVSPETRFSVDRHEVFSGPAYDATQIGFTVVLVAGVVLATTFVAQVARATVREGIRREFDLARLKEAQLKMLMQEKVGALGRIVAGVSHELNNPLGALRSGVDTQERLLEKLNASREDPAKWKRLLGVGRDGLSGLRTAAERISALEVSLRALSHLDEGDIQQVDLHRELETIVEAARRESGAEVEMRIEKGSLPRVELDAAVMSQAFLSLVGWMLRASEPGRPPLIRTEAGEDEVFVDIEGGARAYSAEELENLFEVHFDSTGVRVRAEMALAAARAAAIRHGGDVTAEARPGGGACFRVRLPRRPVGGHP